MRKSIRPEEVTESFVDVLYFFRRYADTTMLIFRLYHKTKVINYFNETLPDSIIKYEIDRNKKRLSVYLKLNDEVISWLGDKKPFDMHVEAENKNLETMLVLFNGEKEVVFFSDCYQCTFINDRQLDEKYVDYMISLRKKKAGYIYCFMDKFQEYRASAKKIPIAEFFFDIDTRAITAVFDRKLLGKYQLWEFYEEHDVMDVIATLLVDKAQKSEISNNLLYEWFIMHTLLSSDEFKAQRLKIVGADKIYAYLLSLGTQEFLSSFPYHHRKFNSYFLDKISSLWHEHGIDPMYFGDEDIVKILEVWWNENLSNTRYKKNIFTVYYAYANRFPTREERLKKIYARQRSKHYRPDFDCRADRSYLYFYGIFVDRDLVKAFRMMKIAAMTEDNIDCQYDLARCYLNGWGTEKDIEQAKHWFEVAAMNGHPKAREQLDRIENAEHNGR